MFRSGRLSADMNDNDNHYEKDNLIVCILYDPKLLDRFERKIIRYTPVVLSPEEDHVTVLIFQIA